jgi:hypothetical protein
MYQPAGAMKPVGPLDRWTRSHTALDAAGLRKEAESLEVLSVPKRLSSVLLAPIWDR